MPAESIDLILTDPPYGIDVDNAHTFKRMTVTDTHFEDGDFETFDLLDKAIKEMYRILKNDRHMYMFCGIDKFPTLITMLRKHGFDPHHIPLIWDKGSGSYPSQSTTYVHSYEACIHVRKGKRKLNGTPRDIFPVKRVPSGRKIHPTEKPTELLRDLIGLSTLPGENILDPFAGSGATLVAARETNRKAIGIELSPKYYEGIVKRLAGEDVSTLSDDDTEA
jgi:site-specific DNA-methyltransferase (adenine-specific)